LGSGKNKKKKYAGTSKPALKTVVNRHSTGIGTPLYMSPEQRYGSTGEYNYLADIYSLGLIFFEIWVGHLFTTNQHYT
jgi:serine/threonine protein kinase